MIRKANPNDIQKIAELSYIIWQDQQVYMVKGIDRNTWIYEIDGEVAGCLIAYPGNKELEMERAWLDMTLDDDIRAYGSPMPMKEANDDEWYIETVATFPQYRGRGVATQLVKHVLNAYKDEKWSLNCDVTNEGALSV